MLLLRMEKYWIGYQKPLQKVQLWVKALCNGHMYRHLGSVRPSYKHLDELGQSLFSG